jgi:hypothetical protein
MTTSGSFPFGAPVRRMPPSRTQPSAVFVLGAYPSALHVAWTPPPGSGLQHVRALAVDNEPTPFWDGADEAERVAAWSAEHFDAAWGVVRPAGAGGNGSYGRWVASRVLAALRVDPASVCFTDCLDTYRASKGQAGRLDDTYDSFAATYGVDPADLAAHPSESEIVGETVSEHLPRLRSELEAAAPSRVITLGSAAARVFHTLTQRPGPPQGLRQHGYGEERRVSWRGKELRWIPLVHPGQRRADWQSLHASWMVAQGGPPEGTP